MQPHVLIIDDQESIRLFLAATLEAKGYRVSTAGDGGEGLSLAAEGQPDLVLLDLRLPDIDGFEVLARLKNDRPDIKVIILTSYGRSEAAAEAMRLQAFDFVTKPVNLDHLLAVIHRGLQGIEGRDGQPGDEQVDDLFTVLPGAVPSRSKAMIPIGEMVRKITASGRSTVLLTGESGVGKDILAQIIHRNSPRRDFPFLEINCAALPEQLLESELFGHERGAFTDATQQKLGLLELAHSGTLFLDEIGEMPLQIQVKLLRVLEKMTFRRVGGLEDIQVNVRIIAATNRNLATQVRVKEFREDLYFRLKVIEITLPPLRDRPEDIPGLARHFLRQYNEEFGREFKDLSPDALELLASQPWPGNIRQLRNTLERSVLLEQGTLLTADQLAFDAALASDEIAGLSELAAALVTAVDSPLPDDGVDLDDLIRRLERAMIRKAMDASDTNQSRAARMLRLGRDRLRYRLRAHGLEQGKDTEEIS